MLAWLNAPLDLRSVAAQVSGWAGTWEPWLANRLPRRLLAPEVALDVRMEGDSYVVEIGADSGATEERYGSPEELSLALDHHRVTGRRHGLTTVARLRVSADDFISHHLRLPAQARRNLSAAAELQIDTETPFNVHNVHVSALATERAARGGYLDVEVVIVPRRRLQDLLKRWSTVDIRFDEVIASSPARPGLEHAIIACQKDKRSRWLWSLAAGLSLAVIVLGAVAICAPIIIRQEFARALESEAATKISAAAKIDADLDLTVAQLQALQSPVVARQAAPSFLLVLHQITDATTDTTFLERFAYRGGIVEIAGITLSTSDLIDQLTRTGLLKAPTYLSPVSPASDGRERFNLSLKLVGAP